MYFLVFLVSAAAVIFGWYWKRQQFFDKIKCYPSPKTFPILGNLLEVIDRDKLFSVMSKHQEQLGDVYKIYIGPMATYLVITDYDFLEFIFTSKQLLEKSNEYEFFRNWLGNGLFTAPVHIWSDHRKMIAPAFNYKILENMVDRIGSNTDTLIEILKINNTSEGIDIYEYLKLYGLDVICETAMGISANAQQNKKSEFVQASKELIRVLSCRLANLFTRINFLYKFTSDYTTEQKSVDVFHKLAKKIIQQKRNKIAENSEANVVNEFGIKHRKAFLDLMLMTDLKDDEIRDEVNTVLFGGHDTNTSGTCFVLNYLAKYPDIQKKVYEELKAIIGDNKIQKPTYSDLMQMKYLDMVIKETMRLCPPVLGITRLVSEDIDYKGTTLPKGLKLAVNIYSLHRKPETFPDPEKFDPERFSAENQTGRHPYSYIPFSAGPRNCIGMKFAMLSMKFVICELLRNFKIRLVPGKEMSMIAEVVMKPKNGLFLKLEEI